MQGSTLWNINQKVKIAFIHEAFGLFYEEASAFGA